MKGSISGNWKTAESKNDKTCRHSSNMNAVKLKIREEQLDISKKWLETAEVTAHKEVIREERTVVIPVTREELVIEKRALSNEASGESAGHTETIRIPISEERIEVSKHHVDLEKVKVYRRQFDETKKVEETLKKELLHVKTVGHPIVVNTEDLKTDNSPKQ